MFKRPMGNSKSPFAERLSWLFVLLSVFVVIWAANRALNLKDTTVLDEEQTVEQVKLFRAGIWSLYHAPGDSHPSAAMLPGYSLTLSLLSCILPDSKPVSLRICQFAISILFLFSCVYALQPLVDSSAIAKARIGQMYFLPIAFPYQFLIYTDILSAAINLVALGAAIRNRPTLTGAVMLPNLIVRQDNIAYAAFLWLLLYARKNGWQLQPMNVWKHFQACWALELCAVAFGTFVIWNGRVALDDPSNQSAGLSLGNVWCLLVWGSILFFPLHLATLPRLLNWARSNFSWAIVVLLLFISLASYFDIQHRWNFNEGMLRNYLLHLQLATPGSRLGFAFIAAFTSISLALNMPRKVDLQCLTAFLFMRLLPVLLVEPRYYLSFFLTFLVLRRETSLMFELFAWCWAICLGAVIHFGITGQYFQL